MKRVFSIIVLFFLLILSSGLALAAEPVLKVEYETQPLFSESSMAPGQTQIKWVKVYNNDKKDRRVILAIKNFSDPSGFAGQIEIIISNAVFGDKIFSGSLKDLAALDELELTSVLGAGQNASYNFSSSFQETSGNVWQGKSVGFDVVVGFSEEKSAAANGSGGSSGLGGNSKGEKEKDKPEVLGYWEILLDKGGLNIQEFIRDVGDKVKNIANKSLASLEPAKQNQSENKTGSVLGQNIFVQTANQDSEQGLTENFCVPKNSWPLGYLFWAIVNAATVILLAGRQKLFIIIQCLLAITFMAWWYLEPCGAREWIWPLLGAGYLAGAGYFLREN